MEVIASPDIIVKPSQTADPIVSVAIEEQAPRVVTVHEGRPGLSAYEVAVDNGFEGTEAEWLESLQAAPGAGSDSNYTQSFTFVDTIVVNHGLGKYPAVTIIDTTGDEVVGAVDHNTINQCTVTFSSETSGVIICN